MDIYICFLTLLLSTLAEGFRRRRRGGSRRGRGRGSRRGRGRGSRRGRGRGSRRGRGRGSRRGRGRGSRRGRGGRGRGGRGRGGRGRGGRGRRGGSSKFVNIRAQNNAFAPGGDDITQSISIGRFKREIGQEIPKINCEFNFYDLDMNGIVSYDEFNQTYNHYYDTDDLFKILDNHKGDGQFMMSEFRVGAQIFTNFGIMDHCPFLLN